MIALLAIAGILACIGGLIVTRTAHRSAALGDEAWRRLDAIANLEVHGGEYIDAAELYKILDKPIPEPTDHAARIRTRVGQPPHRSPYT